MVGWQQYRSILAVLVGLAGAGCSDGGPESQKSRILAGEASGAPAGLDPAAISAGETALLGEPKARAVSYTVPRWRVAVDDDGSRRDGFAEYLCLTLSERGAVNGETEVSIVDAADQSRFLGGVHCRTSARLVG